MIRLIPFAALALLAAFQSSPTTRPRDDASLIVTRTDVARAYLAMDRALHEHPPAEARQADINREFDRITMEFAMRRFQHALRALHALTDAIDSQTKLSDGAKFARSLRVRISPAVASSKHPSPLRIRISPLYPIEIDQAPKLRLVITPEGSKRPMLDRAFDEPSTSIIVEQPADAAIGKYRVEIVTADGFHSRACDWFVNDLPIEPLRQQNDRELTAIRAGSEQMAQAVAAVAARNGLLSDQPSETDPARMLLDPVELSRQVTKEISELQADRDPFVDRPGDYWRTITMGAMQTPARIYAPPAAVSGKPVAVVIALHGAGGDENMFMEAYGAGEMKRQADLHGFLLVTPKTDFALLAPDGVDSVIRALSFDYMIDRSRVYMIGHSLGGLTAQQWNQRWGNKLAAVCLIDGCAPFTPGARIAPTLVFNGENDPMFPLARVQGFVDDAQHAKLAVELRSLKLRGHTLGVGEVLPVAIDWLLQHRTPPAGQQRP